MNVLNTVPNKYPFLELPGCVLHYDMQDLGNISIDHSGYMRHGINSGCVPKAAPSGYSRYFDGVDDGIVITETTDNNTIRSGSFTVTLWFKTIAFAPHCQFFVKPSFTLTCECNSGSFSFQVGAVSVNCSDLPVGIWHHYAMKLDVAKANTVDNMTIWIDGVKRSNTSTNVTSVTQNNDQFRIMGGASIGPNGYLGDFKVYNRALTDEEIKALCRYESVRYNVSR